MALSHDNRFEEGSLDAIYNDVEGEYAEDDYTAPKNEEEFIRWVAQNRKLLYRVAHSYDETPIPGYEFSDLVQQATIGAMNALDSYDPSKGSKWSTYATQCAMNELRMLNRLYTTEKRGPERTMASLDETPSDDRDNKGSRANVVKEEMSISGDKVESPEETVTSKAGFQKVMDLASEAIDDKKLNILIRFLEGEPVPSIARDTGYSTSYISSTCKAAHSTLRWYLSQHGIFSTSDII